MQNTPETKKELPNNNRQYILEELAVLMGCVPYGLGFNGGDKPVKTPAPLFLIYPLQQPTSFREGYKQLSKQNKKPVFDIRWLGINLSPDKDNNPHYIARFHDSTMCKKLLQEKDKYLLFLISVNKSYHRDEQRIATINLFERMILACAKVVQQKEQYNEKTVENAEGTWHILIVVADTLQAYNKSNDDETQRAQASRYQKKGEDWKKIAEPIFNRLKEAGNGIIHVKITFVHWQELLTQAKEFHYQTHYEHLLKIYINPTNKTESDFRKAVQTMGLKHAERMGKKKSGKAETARKKTGKESSKNISGSMSADKPDPENNKSENQLVSFSDPKKNRDETHNEQQHQLLKNYILDINPSDVAFTLKEFAEKETITFNPPLWHEFFYVRRENLCEQILSLPPDKPLCFYGIDGAGKTSLAADAYYTITCKLRCWITNPLDSFRKIGQSLLLFGQKTPAAEAIQLLKYWFEENPGCFIVFDDCEYDEIKNFIPKHTYVIYTTRKKPTLEEDVNFIEIPEMELDEAVQLLKKRGRRSEIPDDNLKILAERLGKLPLALEQAAAYLAKHTEMTVKKYLEEYEKNLAEVMCNTTDISSGHKSVIATYKVSLNHIREEKATKDNKKNAKQKDKANDGIILEEELLTVCSYLASNNIPPRLLREWFNKTHAQEAKDNSNVLKTSVDTLITHCLLKYNPKTNMLSIPLVLQDVMRLEYSNKANNNQANPNLVLDISNLLVDFTTPTTDITHYHEHSLLLPHFEHALKNLRGFRDDFANNVLIRVLSTLGRIYENTMPNLEVAIKYLLEAIELQKHSENIPPEEIIKNHLSVSEIYYQLSGRTNIDLAIAHAEVGFNLCHDFFVENHSLTGRCCNKLAKYYSRTGETELVRKATQFAKNANAIAKVCNEEKEQQQSLIILYESHMQLGELRKGYQYLTKICSSASNTLMPPDMATFFNTFTPNKYPLAFDTSIFNSITQKLLSLEKESTDINTLLSLYGELAYYFIRLSMHMPALGQLYNLSLLNTAKKYCDKYLELWETFVKLDFHPNLADIYLYLAEIHRGLFEKELAIKYAYMALNINMRFLGKEHPKTLICMILTILYIDPDKEIEVIKAIKFIEELLPTIENQKSDALLAIYSLLINLHAKLNMWGYRKEYCEKNFFFLGKFLERILVDKKHTWREHITALKDKTFLCIYILHTDDGRKMPYNGRHDFFMALFQQYYAFFSNVEDYSYHARDISVMSGLLPYLNQRDSAQLFNVSLHPSAQKLLVMHVPFELARACVRTNQLDLQVYSETIQAIFTEKEELPKDIVDMFYIAVCQANLRIIERNTNDASSINSIIRELLNVMSYLPAKIPLSLLDIFLQKKYPDPEQRKDALLKVIDLLNSYAFIITDGQTNVVISGMIQQAIREYITSEEKRRICSFALSMLKIFPTIEPDLDICVKQLRENVIRDLFEKYQNKTGLIDAIKMAQETLLRTIASYSDDPCELEILISLGVNLNAADPKSRKTALHFAVSQQKMDNTLLLLRSGANAKATDAHKKNPFDDAAHSKEKSKIDWLISLIENLSEGGSANELNIVLFLIENYAHIFKAHFEDKILEEALNDMAQSDEIFKNTPASLLVTSLSKALELKSASTKNNTEENLDLILNQALDDFILSDALDDLSRAIF